MNDSEIVVGLDNSPPAKAALRWAAEQARLIDVRLRAVSVVDWPLGVQTGARCFELPGLGNITRSGMTTAQ
jgi:nucleotide-binding universal stress UspA family protein